MNINIDQPSIQLTILLAKLCNLHSELSRKTLLYPKGNLRIGNHEGVSQFYHVTSNDKKGTYITKEQTNIARELAQKGYEQKLAKVLEKQTRQIKDFLQRFSPNELVDAFEKLNPERQKLVEPFFVSDKEFAVRWSAVSFKSMPFAENAPEHYASNGLRVRSKSEVLIANTLIRLGIPFRYEAPLKIHTKKNEFNKSSTFHPDFTCLNIKTRQEFIWEHFGLMNNEEYLNNAIEKTKLFAAAGFIPGINYITTMESNSTPLNIKYVEQLAKRLLK